MRAVFHAACLWVGGLAVITFVLLVLVGGHVFGFGNIAVPALACAAGIPLAWYGWRKL